MRTFILPLAAAAGIVHRWTGMGRGSRCEAELHLHPDRRHGLERFGLPGQHLLRDAALRQARGPEHAVHQRLRRLPGLLADQGQHHHRQVPGPPAPDRLVPGTEDRPKKNSCGRSSSSSSPLEEVTVRQGPEADGLHVGQHREVHLGGATHHPRRSTASTLTSAARTGHGSPMLLFPTSSRPTAFPP